MESIDFNIKEKIMLVKITLYLLVIVSFKDILFQKKVHLGIIY